MIMKRMSNELINMKPSKYFLKNQSIFRHSFVGFSLLIPFNLMVKFLVSDGHLSHFDFALLFDLFSVDFDVRKGFIVLD